MKIYELMDYLSRQQAGDEVLIRTAEGDVPVSNVTYDEASGFILTTEPINDYRLGCYDVK